MKCTDVAGRLLSESTADQGYAAEGDSVIANDVDAQGWGLLVAAGAVPTVTTLTLSSRHKATFFRIILWRCWGRSEHGIARPKGDLKWA